MVVVLPSLAILTALAILPLTGAEHGGNDNGQGDDTFSRVKARIKNIVVLIQENRSFDNMAGGFTYSDEIDGLLNKQLCNPINITDPSAGTVCATDTLANVDGDDPNHGVTGVNMEIFGNFHPTADSPETMQGFLFEQQQTFDTSNLTRAEEAIQFYNENNIPVMRTLAEEFVLFDKWFCAVPGPTDPNRAYITAGTSDGHGQNDAAFSNAAIPVRSIFQQLSEKNVSWINYTPSQFFGDAAFYTWTVTSGALFTNMKLQSQFFEDAAAGTLPPFSYINPECCSNQSFHPPSSATNGQIFVKSIYEALRASPQWDETLFIMTFDEHGGFADHVPPPKNVPAPDNITYTETAQDGKNFTFDFTRLGVRVPAYLISPWVGKSVIEHEGQNNGKVYTHTSILHFLAGFFGLDILTPRVGFSSTFEHLILDKKRDDTLETLPTPFQF